MSDTVCEHLNCINNAKINYNIVIAYYVTCIAEGAKKRKATDARCRLCKSSNRRLHACLECAFFGCLDKQNGMLSHLKAHAFNNSHFLSVNINHGSLFCVKCNDYVFDEVFENIYHQYRLEAMRMKGEALFLPWKPNSVEIAGLQNKMTVNSDSSNRGFRGIPNIKHSCYINCVIQVLVHTSALRDYFLCDRHKCFKSVSCLMCEMFVLFQEFYSGITVPFNPLERFFPALQEYCSSPLGLNPQDAYLFFLEILEGLHVNCQENNQIEICDCVIHNIFFGFNRSFKECIVCKDSSPLPLNHFADILLDKYKNHDSLVKILDEKFSKSQVLNVNISMCKNCEVSCEFHIFQTIEKLPLVICFRMNWMSGNCEDGTAKKKSTSIKFEELIDMSPYLYAKYDPNDSPSKNCMLNSNSIDNVYRLYAVIFHKGDAEGGHYHACIQQHNRWYECNDMFIYEKNFEYVRQCEPLLLFYHKQI